MDYIILFQKKDFNHTFFDNPIFLPILKIEFIKNINISPIIISKSKSIISLLYDELVLLSFSELLKLSNILSSLVILSFLLDILLLSEHSTRYLYFFISLSSKNNLSKIFFFSNDS